MDYHKIPELISLHKERVARCESILRDYHSYSNPPPLQFSLQVGERYLRAGLEENKTILRMLIKNSNAAIVRLEKQHARLLAVSSKFK